MTAYGLPKPDHKLFEAHPTVSSELLPRLGHGDIAVKPNIDRFPAAARSASSTAARRRSTSSSTAPATRSPSRSSTRRSSRRRDNRLPLYRRVVSVERPGLYFIGFIQPLGPIMPLAEAQCEWVADLLGGPGDATGGGGDASGDRERRTEAWRSASSPLSVIPSRSTSIPICARSGASESGLRSRLDDPGAAARAGSRATGSAAPPPWGPPRAGRAGGLGRGVRA